MRIGIDLGGTKIEAVALDRSGKELARKRVLTPQGDYQGTLKAMKSLVEEIDAAIGVRDVPIGIGAPGIISPVTGLMKNSNSICLIGKPLDRDLEALLKRPVRIANDANCFALSEAIDGAAAGAKIVFGVIIGTGTGGGIVIDGKVIEGPNKIAGEWGHNPLPWMCEDEFPGAECYCGRRGCIETFLSGPGLIRSYAQASGVTVANGGEVEVLAQNQDVIAEKVLALYEDRLARSLATVINFLDPDYIVLGGGVSNIERLYLSVPKLWMKYIFSDSITTKLVKAKYGDSSGVRGAAWLWPVSN